MANPQNLISGLLDLAGNHLDREDKQEFAREMMLKESDIQMADKKEFADYASTLDKKNADYKLSLEKDLLKHKADLEEQFRLESDKRERALYDYKKGVDTENAKILLKQKAELEEKFMLREEMKDAISNTGFLASPSETETRGPGIFSLVNPLVDSHLTKEFQEMQGLINPQLSNLKLLAKDDPVKMDVVNKLNKLYDKMNTSAYMDDDIFSDDSEEINNVNVLRALIEELGGSVKEAKTKEADSYRQLSPMDRFR